ncbi:copper resistance protein B, partial [Idiomarina sp. UBA4206]|uniref:copper resistance protein B n=1 Tax=Idiomarina sp. UBA4206 TaxID=1946644 RepID=UPI00257E10AD
MVAKSLLFTTALLPAVAMAGHAEEGWPEPVKEYYTGQVLFDRLELTRTDEEENVAVWDMMAWYGGDYHRFVFKSE